MGYITKRTRTQPEVIRYVRFSQTKCPKKFYQSILQSFLPDCADVQLKPQRFETFEQFYMNGHVKFSDGSKHSVRSVVDQNRSLFEIDAMSKILLKMKVSQRTPGASCALNKSLND